MAGVVFRQADFYSPLDTVRFNPEYAGAALAQNIVSAAGTTMLGLLIGDTKPVLTQAQAIDNAYLLDTLAAADENTQGFLNLVRSRTIQVRFHDRPPLLGAPERFTILNAFASALNRQQNFVLSGWPELNNNSTLRSELVRSIQHITRRDQLAREVETLAGPVVAKRFRGLIRLDRAVKAAGLPQQTVPLPPGSYRETVVDLLVTLRPKHPDADSLFDWLLRRAADAREADSSELRNDAVDLDIRSGWLRLLDLHDEQHPAERKATDLVRRQLNHASSKIIAKSLLSTGRELDLASATDADDLSEGADGDDIPVHRLIHFSRDPHRMDWLTWANVAKIWQDLQETDLSPRERYDYLARLHGDSVFKQKIGEIPALTIAVSAVLGDTIQNFLSGEWQGGAGAAAVAAITGTVVVLLVQREGSRMRARLREHVANEVDAKWEASISHGTASWQDEIGG